jgi:hypothetical protein
MPAEDNAPSTGARLVATRTIRPFERVDIGHCKLDPFP